jgi:cobyrinic acid a,c-diamide synthase
VAGAIANRVGSRGHLDLLRRALKSPPILGGLPRDAEHGFAERHLGLRTADERTVPTALLDHWGDLVASWCPLEDLIDTARAAPAMASDWTVEETRVPARCRIGLARDEAFHFYYPDNLRRLETLGAEIVPFSPVRDGALPDVDGLYFGGGYPELHATLLSENRTLRDGIARFARRGGPIYAECGGLMYLSQAIVTLDGARHSMVGLLPVEATMCTKLQALGYVEVETQAKTLLGPPGSRFRGHQFRYSELSPVPSPESVKHVYSLRRRRGDETVREGYSVDNVVASYVHAHWASNPRVASELVQSCVRYRQERLS